MNTDSRIQAPQPSAHRTGTATLWRPVG